MDEKRRNDKLKRAYEPPKVLATYTKEDLKEAIRPHGPSFGYGSCGCGCTFP